MNLQTPAQPAPDQIAAAVDGLRSSLKGEALLPGDQGYDDARAVWNAMIDRHPAVIVRCRGVADVIDAVNFAGEQALPVAIRGGAHMLPARQATGRGASEWAKERKT